MIITTFGGILVDVGADKVVRTFDANSPPRPLTEVYTLKGNTVATITHTYTSSGTSLIPTTSVRT